MMIFRSLHPVDLRDEVNIGPMANCTRDPNRTDGPCSAEIQYIGYMYVLTPMTITGVVLNIINQVIFFKYRTQGSTYFYLYVLAVTDMFCLILACPIGSVRCIPASKSWEIWARGIYEAYFYLGLGLVTDTISIWCTTAMSVDRYVQVRASHRSSTVLVEKNQSPKFIMLAIVLASVLLNLPYFFYKELDDEGFITDRPFSFTKGFQIYTWFRMAIIKILPVLTVAVANCLLIKVLVDVNRRRKSMVFPNTKQVKRQRMQIRVSAMLVSILITFVLCHVVEPLSHTSLFAALWGPCKVFTEAHFTQVMITNGLEWFSFSSNFIFYCIFHKQFQASLRAGCCWIIRRQGSNKQAPDMTCATTDESKKATTSAKP